MKTAKGKPRVCESGHTFFKSSDCPVCPECEKGKRPSDGFLSLIGAPARRALEREGIETLDALAKHNEAEILKLHGMGPSSLPKLRKALEDEKLSFRKK